MWKLIIEDDEGQRTIVPLTRDEYSIGRTQGNNLRLTERNVSRTHARLLRTNANGSGEGGYTLEDLRSYNGVFVNGLRVANRQDLHHGDLVQVGDYRVILQDDAIGEIADGEDVKSTLPGARGALLLERPNRLVMLAGPTPGAEYPLDRDRMTVGRAEDASVSVNHSSVSRLHCEIHSLGEARFEIIDKGSSNGVRVNGVDLKRRIIEAGDIIELGDVRLKFVGEGQIFMPGIDERAMSAGASDAPISSRRSEGGSIVPWVILGALLAGGIFAALRYNQQRRLAAEHTPQQIAEESQSADAFVAASACEADKILDQCEIAHTKMIAIPSTAAILSDPEKRKVLESAELRWCETLKASGMNEKIPSDLRIEHLKKILVGGSRFDSTKQCTDDAASALMLLQKVPTDTVNPPVVPSATIEPSARLPRVDSTVATVTPVATKVVDVRDVPRVNPTVAHTVRPVTPPSTSLALPKSDEELRTMYLARFQSLSDGQLQQLNAACRAMHDYACADKAKARQQELRSKQP